MSFDERKTFASTKEDLEQNTADIPAIMQRQVLVIQKAPRTADVPLLQYNFDTTVDVSKLRSERREDTQKTARGLHQQVTEMNCRWRCDLSSSDQQDWSQRKTAAMSFDERKTFVATKEDLEQDIPSMQRACDSEGTENGGCPTASVH